MDHGRFLDLEGWKRREHFDLYRGLERPFWSVTAEVDVTRVWGESAASGRPFFLATCFATLAALNATDAFRLRIRPDGVWLHDSVALSTTVLRDDETFGFAVLRPRAAFDEFAAAARTAMDAGRTSSRLATPPAGADDVVFHSSLPWLRFTAFTNALGRPDDCIPRIVFGRASEAGGVRKMPVAVEVHHALVDGLDVARFFERFEAALAAAR
jgi:chloramphenicol O-acetyltransferase type A